jgi:hypothetical protein
MQKGEQMKGLAAVLVVILLSEASLASPLELSLSAGPAATSLNDINAAIVFVNTLITLLNETLIVIPGVSGSVENLGPMTSGLALRASERYWVDDWIAFGGRFEYTRLATSTRGQYVGAETSTIDVALSVSELSLLVGARVQFLDAELRLAGDIAGGYFYATCNRAVTFEIPSEYPDAISGIPQLGAGRHSGGALGLEAGLSLSYAVTDGLCLEALLSYRSATIPRLDDAAGQPLDLDANDVPESAVLDGLSVEVGFSLSIDLSLDGEKGE